MICGPCQVCIEWILFSLLQLEGNSMLLIQLSPSHSIYMLGHTALGDHQWATWCLCLPYMAERGICFQVVFYPMTQSTVNLWWVLNLVILMFVIGYNVNEFIHTWLVDCFVAWWHIYPGFMGKVSQLTHSSLEPDCEDYSFYGPSSQRLSAWSWFLSSQTQYTQQN